MGGSLLAINGCTVAATIAMPGCVIGRHVSMDATPPNTTMPGITGIATCLTSGVATYKLCAGGVAITPVSMTYNLQQ